MFSYKNILVEYSILEEYWFLVKIIVKNSSLHNMSDPYIGKSILLGRPYLFRSRLGNGGFGTVYRATDNNKKSFAIKVITSNDRGIPCLTEASIMATYKHPHLNQAIDFIVVEDTLYIVQEEALCDLHEWIRNKSLLQRGSEDNYYQTLDICYQIGQALSFLHREDIIHGDVKTSNILVCGSLVDPIFKLTDFNLSCHKTWKRSANICTASYRPLEGWEKDWDESVDIWCLGNVLYYCLFHIRLFTSQETHRKEIKEYYAYLNALYDWEALYYKRRGGLAPSRKYYPMNYISPNVEDEIFSIKDHLHDLIISCLNPKKEGRPTSSAILSSKIFKNRTQEVGTILKLSPLKSKKTPPVLKPLPTNVVIDTFYSTNKMSSNANAMTYNTARVANNLYCRYEPYMVDHKDLVIATIAMMAIKITMEDEEINLKKVEDISTLFRIERDVCRRLGFVLF